MYHYYSQILTFCREDCDKFRGRDAFALHYYAPCAKFVLPFMGKIRWMVQSETCGEVNCTRNFLDIAYMENETATKVGLQKQNFESK